MASEQLAAAGAGAAPEPIGALLTRLRLARGFSQLRVAERLCAAAGMPTVSRHEVSRWERGERIPGSFWLGWLAVVLDVPLAELEEAVAVARRPGVGLLARPPVRPPAHQWLWQPPSASELRAALDHQPDGHDLRELAHAWLAGPLAPPMPPIGLVRVLSSTAEALDGLAARLTDLRRMDDLMGGADLAPHLARELRTAIEILRTVTGAGHHRRALRLIAGFAQLAGWVHADAGDRVAAQRAYRVALWAAAAGRDRPFGGHVLGALSHHTLDHGDPQDALLLARTAHTGVRHEASAFTQALLLQRVALAAALAGERRAAHAALTAADQAADRSEPGREPPWLGWLDRAELAAMTGRCLVALGRPLRGARLLTAPRRGIGPRTASLYGGCLARAYLELGEVEQACRLARRALRDAVAAGSPRAAARLRRLHPRLVRHRDLPAVRGYERIAGQIAAYLPRPGEVAGPGAGTGPAVDSVEA